jgi:hypothetical protein
MTVERFMRINGKVPMRDRAAKEPQAWTETVRDVQNERQ